MPGDPYGRHDNSQALPIWAFCIASLRTLWYTDSRWTDLGRVHVRAWSYITPAIETSI